ncbi:hypothetical protein GCM10007860_26130 [Chitiniphilus shinanonensis]|uniref:DUF2917 domain-containing protein n=1 Tax=Chitiniphilus shinanonensis TaxID=553088 RepID=A0ABQ6BTX8_9NEIS|nr:DUF2917 domain-containing protein [Chitiniphilus shinanonensis]GLS05460.1 hypothetical protein GCM10007860_26130 [Chitiniphilus shinanonensis]
MKTTMLHCQGLLALEYAGPVELRCIAGALWITEHGCDLIVRAGERCRLQGGDKALVQALRPSHFSIEAPQSPPLRWLARWLPRLRRIGRRTAPRYAY